MASIGVMDASEMTTRELNALLKKASKTEDLIEITNPGARHNIVVGILDECHIKINGSVGYYSASLLDGPTVDIDGNAGWALGENLMTGRIYVSGDV